MSCTLISNLATPPPGLLTKAELDLASRSQQAEHGASNTGVPRGHEPTTARLTNALSTPVQAAQTGPQVASTSPCITPASLHTSAPMSSSVSVASAPSGPPANSTPSSSFNLNGDAKSMVATGTPVLSVSSQSGSTFSGGAGGVSSSGTSSPSKTPQPRWVGVPSLHSHSSSLSGTESLDLPTSKFQYGNNMLPGGPQQPMFDYSHLPPQQQHNATQGQRPWDTTMATSSMHGGHAQHASPALSGRPGGVLGGPSAGAPGGAFRAYGTNDFFTPRGFDPNSGMLGGAHGGLPGAPGGGPSTMLGAAAPSSLLHPMHQAMDGGVDPFCYPALQQAPLPAPVRLPKKGKNHKKADGKQPTFLTKLYE